MLRPVVMLLVMLVGVPATAAAQDAQTLADRLGDSVDVREVPSSTGVAYGRATAVVNAPLDQVMAVITDYARYQNIMPHFRRSRVLSQRGNNALVYMQASVARDTVQLWAQMRIYERRPRGQTRIIEGRMTEGNMDHFVARWEATPLGDDRTLLRFDLLVDPAIPVPSSLVTAENVKNARRAVGAVRRHAAQPRYVRLAQNR
jgi:ribosome-associated toxin RatA of RatAB toxin-antitoxin module